ncbi:Hypothetical protein, putative, partial [Bodo saltans]
MTAAQLYRTNSRKFQHAFYEHTSAEVIQRYPADGQQPAQRPNNGSRSVTSYSAAQPLSSSQAQATPHRTNGGPSAHDVTVAWTSPLPLNPSSNAKSLHHTDVADSTNYSPPPPLLTSTRSPPQASSALRPPPAAVRADPMAALDAGVGELEQLLDSWQELERETDNILDL